MTSLTQLSLQDLISVQAPYYNLINLEITGPDSVRALAPVEMPIGYEISHMANSETGRHLAILGSLACALRNPLQKKCYYLATNAIYKNLQFEQPLDKIDYGFLKVESTCTKMEKRKASALNLLLSPEGKPLASIEVDYFILPAPMFEKFNSSNYMEQPNFDLANPYNKEIPFLDYQLDLDKLEAKADLGLIHERYCAGHFNHYPALPVAMVIHQLYRGAIQLAEGLIGKGKLPYEPKIAYIGAKDLGFAGSQVSMQWRIAERDGWRFRLIGQATTQEQKIIGDLDLEVYFRP